ncbi:MAG: hypothetical protein LBC43_04310 [Bifidobacteriaceae bacterium]|jgi:hypothetical protein|nr:hypothetical protein [Bifidobacteriaceae bacterium]
MTKKSSKDAMGFNLGKDIHFEIDDFEIEIESDDQEVDSTAKAALKAKLKELIETKQDEKKRFFKYARHELRGVKPGNSPRGRERLINFLKGKNCPKEFKKYLKGIYVDPNPHFDSGGNFDHLQRILIRPRKDANSGIFVRFYYTPSPVGYDLVKSVFPGLERDSVGNDLFPPMKTKFLKQFSVIKAVKHSDGKWGISKDPDLSSQSVFNKVSELLSGLFRFGIKADVNWESKETKSGKKKHTWRPSARKVVRATLDNWSVVLSPEIWEMFDENYQDVFTTFDNDRDYAVFGKAKNDPRYNSKTGAFQDDHRLITSPLALVKGNEYYTEENEVYTLNDSEMNHDYKIWLMANRKRAVSWTELKESWKKWDKPLRHICEVCGKDQILTPEEAFEQGWDYPPKMGEFGIVSPRTCETCSIKDTLWWELATNEDRPSDTDKVKQRKLETAHRIKAEPMSILPKGYKLEDLLFYLGDNPPKSKKDGK